MDIDLIAFLQTLLTTVLTYAGGVIPAFVVGWIVDRLLVVVPALRPFRELIIQWVRRRLEEIRLERAKATVIAAGEKFRNDSMREAKHIGALSTDRVEELKVERKENAIDRIVTEKIAPPGDAAKLVDAAVAELRNKGVNP